MKRAPVIAGSFADAEHLRLQGHNPVWRPNDIYVFTDSAATFELLIYLFHTTVLIPLRLRSVANRACHYTSDDEREEHPIDVFVYSSRNYTPLLRAHNATLVRQCMATMLDPQSNAEHYTKLSRSDTQHTPSTDMRNPGNGHTSFETSSSNPTHNHPT